MKKFSDYIYESLYDEYFKLSDDAKKQLLELDLEYGEIALIARYETVVREVSNIDEEYDKFMDAHSHGDKYYPTLKYKSLKYVKYNLHDKCKKLLAKFADFNCYLSKYYIQKLKGIINKINYLDELKNASALYNISSEKINAFDTETLDYAFDIVKNQPYEEIDKTISKYQKSINADEAAEIIEQELSNLGYDWTIIKRPNMLPRMGVNPEKTFRIKSSSKFSEVDIQSLIAHEIKAHVAKRYYGYKTGLFLFVFGLDGKNLFDEGLAIWNTLNISKEHKPNPLFTIALSYIVCYYCSIYDFNEAFDKLHDLVDGKRSDKTIFRSLIRAKRSVIKTDRLGYWSGDLDYFKGYLLVDKMTDEERDDILKYNVGLNDIFDLDNIKKFIEINNFKEIENWKLEKIKSNYEDLNE